MLDKTVEYAFCFRARQTETLEVQLPSIDGTVPLHPKTEALLRPTHSQGLTGHVHALFVRKKNCYLRAAVASIDSTM